MATTTTNRPTNAYNRRTGVPVGSTTGDPHVPVVVLENLGSTRDFDRAARIAAGLSPHDTRPVHLVAGDQAPVEVGDSWHFTNKSGDIIHHPTAYSRKGHSSMVYHHSTRAVEVGAQWRPEVW